MFPFYTPWKYQKTKGNGNTGQKLVKHIAGATTRESQEINGILSLDYIFGGTSSMAVHPTSMLI